MTSVGGPRLRLAQGLWWVYGACYLMVAVPGLLIGAAIPLLVAVPLLVVALLFAIVFWSSSPRLVLTVAGIACMQFLLGNLLLGGPGSAWTFAGHRWADPSGVPRVLALPLWIVGVLGPVVLTGWVLRRLGRQGQPTLSSGAA
jgi:hypothetical protein